MDTTIETLYKRGLNKSVISRAVCHELKTVDKVIRYLDSGGKLPKKKPHTSKLNLYFT